MQLREEGKKTSKLLAMTPAAAERAKGKGADRNSIWRHGAVDPAKALGCRLELGKCREGEGKHMAPKWHSRDRKEAKEGSGARVEGGQCQKANAVAGGPTL